ncbi:MAG: carboxylating nicotinate-nucleotide diphosphorylase [Longimicrobiaceae bacterium]
MNPPEPELALIRLALAEDTGAGDVTTLWTVSAEARAEAVVQAKSAGVLAGTGVAGAVFREVDPYLQITAERRDGEWVEPDDTLLRVSGAARSILIAERTALNFLQRLSGVATLTRRYVAAVEGTGARVLDTRKTTPGMRGMEKLAVRAGGGENHRLGLSDMVLIKENHLALAGGVGPALERVMELREPGVELEVEVRTLRELDEVLASGVVDRILLDNMPLPVLHQALERIRSQSGPRPSTEASGGVTLENARLVAESGVDFISVGALTHSAPALDLTLRLEAR